MHHPNFHLIDQCYAEPFGQEAMARFLAAHGTRKRATPLPAEVRLGIPREAFRNAWDLALTSRAEYWEGYAWHPECGALPFHHAWCVDPRSGAVWDTTWRDVEGAVYLGVYVPTERLCATLNETGAFGILDKGVGFEHRTVADLWGWIDPTRPAALRDRDRRRHRLTL
ncbi:hypothetical protein [Pseudooceanicola nanhaiensis]|uniref:hypothetical protein n=1 Tax=Pseudooceanicola nanhaiensis TaxID=375761 RepID=UPI003510DF2C